MPLDGKIEQYTETKADPFALSSLIAWLEKQNPELTYDWDDCDGGCLIGIYYASVGVKAGIYSDVFKRAPDYLSAYGEVCATGPWTFGAALDRARALYAQGVR